jgi:malonyl-CoA O-methyltransferase
MVWANMALHQQPRPQELMAQWHKALAVDGFLMFSCLGPDTLRELRDVYRSKGWSQPMHELTDMHDWGDMLVQAGFAEPVMDMERITLTFETPERMVQELRELGRNLAVGRDRVMHARAWHGQWLQALAQLAQPQHGGKLGLTFELVYGHAFKPAPRARVAQETGIDLIEMRQMLRQSAKDRSSS